MRRAYLIGCFSASIIVAIAVIVLSIKLPRMHDDAGGGFGLMVTDFHIAPSSPASGGGGGGGGDESTARLLFKTRWRRTPQDLANVTTGGVYTTRGRLLSFSLHNNGKNDGGTGKDLSNFYYNTTGANTTKSAVNLTTNGTTATSTTGGTATVTRIDTGFGTRFETAIDTLANITDRQALQRLMRSSRRRELIRLTLGRYETRFVIDPRKAIDVGTVS